MPSMSVPSDGPKRKIFVAALQEYRNACHPPELTPGCPFFTWTANGPACGEECADLLADYGDKGDAGQVDLGGGIVISRQTSPRRPRRGPSSSDKPFDAREIYLSDEHRPHADRRTPALFVELGDLVLRPPAYWADPNERSYDIGAVREQLTIRGFDADAIIRFGLASQLAISLTMHVILSIGEGFGDQLPSLPAAREAGIPTLGEDWIGFFNDALKADIPDATGDFEQVAFFALHGFLDRIISWLNNASLEDIFSWTAPNLAQCDLQPDSDDQRRRREQAQWVVDRFTGAYERDWALPSLHLEWLYLHGNAASPCSPTAMAERRTDAQVISNQIAGETSRAWSHAHEGLPKRGLSAEDFVAVALGHLRNGKPEVAASIFEALIYVSPNDAGAHNNYGFCMLTQNPAASLKAFTKASQLQKDGSLTTLANTVLALHLLRQDVEALALGSSETASDLPAQEGWMWLCSDDHELTLSEPLDVRAYLRDLTKHIEDTCIPRT